jgi:peroxiredoxin (alkyl hydroperoxide reductase subunit C)
MFIRAHSRFGVVAALISLPLVLAACNSPQGSGVNPTAAEMQKPSGALAALAKSSEHMPLIGELAPSFEATTTQGHVSFPGDYKGKWVVLFSHPGDFTPVCTTEFLMFSAKYPEFRAINCELLGLSVDSNFSHIAWLRAIQEKIKYKGMENVVVPFPIIADVKMDVAKMCGMVQPAASDTQAVRAVFIIDPNAKVRAILYYPLTNGRNIDEIFRLVVALQTTDAHKVSTPANWQPGDDVIIPPPGSCGLASQRVAQAGSDYYCLDWFLCFKALPKDKLVLPASEK